MRRPALIMLSILVVGGASLLVGANMLLGTFENDARLAKELTNLLAQRDDIASGSRVRVIRRPAGEKTLAEIGRGVVLTLEPSASVRGRRGGMDALLGIVVRETVAHYRGRATDWVELHLRFDGAKTDPFRTLLRRTGEQEFGLPEPAIPGE